MILTLALGLTLALVLGIIAQRMRLSPLVGYLIAGIIAGSHLFGLEVDSELISGFSHLGVVLLLFGVGMQFHFKDLQAVYKTVVPGALLCIVINICLGTLAYSLVGASFTHELSAVMYGLCICVSSTVVLTRVLSDNKVLHTPSGHTAIGWLVVEDIFTIMLLILLPVIVKNDVGEGGLSAQVILSTLAWMVAKIAVLIIFVVLIGRYILPKVLAHLSRSSSGDLFTLAVLVIALGIAVISAYVFNASMEFGAFLSGMIVGQSRFSFKAASEAIPMRDAFAVLFFLSVGMGFDWDGIVQEWQLVLATACICILIKPLMAFTFIRLLGKPSRMSVYVSGSLSQIGEFSFILASLAAGTYNLLPASAVNAITGVAILSITINSIAYRFLPKLIAALEHKGIGLLKQKDAAPIPEVHEDQHRLIVVGYGPCGQLVTRILQKYEMEVVIIEMNIDTVTELQALGMHAMLGDARLESILRMAGTAKSTAIVITSPAAPAQEITIAARNINPDIQVMAHTQYHRHAQRLRAEGAEHVISGEEEVAITMTTTLLHGLGATSSEISKEQHYVRKMLAEIK
ncbi:MAG: cation:proton antiporter [Akkermansia sp.]